MDTQALRRHLQTFDFPALFIEGLGWLSVRGARPKALSGPGLPANYTAEALAELSGVVVYRVQGPAGDFPEAAERRALQKALAQESSENLVIFCDREQTRSVWYWLKRDGKREVPREHFYLRGQSGDLFLSKLQGLLIELKDLERGISISEVTQRLAQSLDVERVTKKFYGEFSGLRLEFTALISGIDSDSDRAWYASVLLNRLMFIYFLQKKGFIDGGDRAYLSHKLEQSQTRGPDRFYSEFLHLLFFEGFAKPPDKRSPLAKELLGQVRYLNGGLFLQHPLEAKYPAIAIPDAAFAGLFRLFEAYSWHLDDSLGGQDNEISPHVLGYIFEKYINQKAFGAYYTRPEITTYLCEQSIHAALLDKLNTKQTRQAETLGEALLRLDDSACRVLLEEVLPKLSILDPACGSGAFLVAAMNTLRAVYSAVFGKMQLSTDRYLKDKLAAIQREHPSVDYYIRKRIISDNLFGVDIMQEATEIAKLRLFLALVAAADRAEALEPLPNIDFNIMAGNSLVGLLRVDESRLAVEGQTDFIENGKIESYRRQLAEKNRQIDLYRRSSTLTEDLGELRGRIEALRAAAYKALNAILLDDFQGLKIKFEQARPEGKSDKRALTPADIEALHPFHWGYEFDEIISTRGGFDVLIANPPWETFKPDSKEFFADHSGLVSKKKMSIKDFEAEQAKLLRDPEVLAAWLAYQSRFPHVSAYFRSSPQYPNQIALVNGKKAGTDINLYKLFTEQIYNLLRPGGQAGIVVPSGIYTDLGTKQLREMLFSQTTLGGLFGFENRKEIFEGVHRSFKFVVLNFKKGGATTSFPAAFMRQEVSELEAFPRSGGLPMPVDLIRRLAPDSLSVMEFKTELDVQIAEKMLHFPLLGAEVAGKWKVHFGAEFHMTNDSHLFQTAPGPGRLPLYEGKMIHQFTHQWGRPKYWLEEAQARQALLGRAKDTGQILDYQTYRLGFRDVAASTNERTMIMTVLPPNIFCPHTMPVEKLDGRIDAATRLFICCIMNSFVVDAWLRRTVTNHLTFFFLYQLPVPRLSAGEAGFAPLVEGAARLICTTPEFDPLAQSVGLTPLPVIGEGLGVGSKYGLTDPLARAALRAELDGRAAHLYGLTEAEFAHVLGTFPLVGVGVKAAALTAYRDLA
jgi:hypothetical protein